MITQLKFVGIPTTDQDLAPATRVVLFTPEGHENRIGTFFNGSFACDDVSATYRQLKSP
ncbi:MAG TPA: hypothetical protein VKG63_12780 [Steroidobacteraceae bacterium]|nr:hypothetical protein [Steroidobacteraceae bacterium]